MSRTMPHNRFGHVSFLYFFWSRSVGEAHVTSNMIKYADITCPDIKQVTSAGQSHVTLHRSKTTTVPHGLTTHLDHHRK